LFNTVCVVSSPLALCISHPLPIPRGPSCPRARVYVMVEGVKGAKFLHDVHDCPLPGRFIHEPKIETPNSNFRRPRARTPPRPPPGTRYPNWAPAPRSVRRSPVPLLPRAGEKLSAILCFVRIADGHKGGGAAAGTAERGRRRGM